MKKYRVVSTYPHGVGYRAEKRRRFFFWWWKSLGNALYFGGAEDLILLDMGRKRTPRKEVAKILRKNVYYT